MTMPQLTTKTGEDGSVYIVERTDSTVLDEILTEVREIKARMDKVESMTSQVIADVKPTLDELMNSSFFKMLGMKKKN